MTRFFGKESPGYDEIVKIFQSNNIPALNAFVQSSTCVELLEQDKNYGLALQGYPEKKHKWSIVQYSMHYFFTYTIIIFLYTIMVVEESLVLHRLKALTKIYSVISLSEIAAKLRLGASAEEMIEKKIVRLVMRGEIAAKIDHVSGVVHFAPEDSSVVSDDAVIRQRLHGAMQV